MQRWVARFRDIFDADNYHPIQVVVMNVPIHYLIFRPQNTYVDHCCIGMVFFFLFSMLPIDLVLH